MSGKHNKYAIEGADFRLFIVLWSQRQKQDTPHLHFRIAYWLERAWEKARKDPAWQRLLLLAFRSSGKSTLAGLFAAWLLYRNPDLRILVLAADTPLAEKMVRTVKRILERHPLTGHLKPHKPEQWAGEKFTVKRMMELRDPSMLARGVTANITGSRADVIICDDVEVPNTCDTAEKREGLRKRLSELSYVLVPGGTQLYIGTPHNYHSIYTDKPRIELGEEHAFLDGFKRLEIPVLDDGGNSAWPERFGLENIAQIKRATGPNKFASQMMLRPVNFAEGRLDSSLLRIYDHALDYTKEIQTLFLGDKKMVSASAWWDPAFGSATGDSSVMAAVFSDEDGNLYLHHLEYIKPLQTSEVDEATAQCRIVAQLAKDLMLPSLTVEINGIGKFLPAILRNELSKAKAPCKVREVSTTRPKDIRILEAFDAVLAARRLYVHRDVLHTAFVTEMQEWRPGSKRGHDDGLDAAAGAISQQPIRIERFYGSGGHNWMRAGQSHKAKTEFEV